MTLPAPVHRRLAAATWTAFIAQLYVAQFANHAWWNWLNHPLIGLPWITVRYKRAACSTGDDTVLPHGTK